MVRQIQNADEVISQVLNRKRVLNLVNQSMKFNILFSSRVGDSRSRTKSRLSKIDIDARSKEDAEKKFFKQAEKSPMMKDAMRRDMLDVVYVGLKESLNEAMSKELVHAKRTIIFKDKGRMVSGGIIKNIEIN